MCNSPLAPRPIASRNTIGRLNGYESRRVDGNADNLIVLAPEGLVKILNPSQTLDIRAHLTNDWSCAVGTGHRTALMLEIVAGHDAETLLSNSTWREIAHPSQAVSHLASIATWTGFSFPLRGDRSWAYQLTAARA